MLVLTRKAGQTVRIGDDVTITVTRIGGGSVRIGIDAPKSVRIIRGEVQEHDGGHPEHHTR